jgi:hypothetical protein
VHVSRIGILLNAKLQVGLSNFECARSTRRTEHCCCLGNDEPDCLLLQKVCRFDLVPTAPCSLVQTSNDNVCWSIVSCLRRFAGMGDRDSTDGKSSSIYAVSRNLAWPRLKTTWTRRGRGYWTYRKAKMVCKDSVTEELELRSNLRRRVER